MLRRMRFVDRDVSGYEVDGMDPVSLVSKPGRVDAGTATDVENLPEVTDSLNEEGIPTRQGVAVVCQHGETHSCLVGCDLFPVVIPQIPRRATFARLRISRGGHGIQDRVTIFNP